MATTPPQIEREDEQPELDQEILSPAQVFDSQTLAVLQKTEIDQQISTAKKFPRQITKLLSTAGTLVCADAETADECIYALPRGGKVIEGPSVRFAEVMAYSWGNNRCGARVISEDEEFVTALGSFFDLEANVAIAYEVKRRITDKKGNRFNSDMVGVTSNAACSVALRNAILRGIPKAIWRKVYAQARQAVAGDIKTLDTRRTAMLKSFELMGVKREAIFAKLGVKGLDDITLDHLVTLRGIYNAVRENEVAADKAFAPELPQQSEDTQLAAKSKKNLDKIKQKYTQPAEKAGAPKEAATAEKHGAKEAPVVEGASAAQPAVSTPAAAPSISLGGNGNNSNVAPSAEAEPGRDSVTQASGTAATDAKPGSVPVIEEAFVDEDEHGIPLNFDAPEN
jgi:hypothetical protein